MSHDRYASGITQHGERPPKAGRTVTDLDDNEKPAKAGFFSWRRGVNYDRYASGITQRSERPPKAGWTVTDLDDNKKARNSGLLELAEREGFEPSVRY